ncbi:MAG TPA: hypothetical protein VIH31_01875 [Candidatus Paceibacterota bacterium]
MKAFVIHFLGFNKVVDTQSFLLARALGKRSKSEGGHAIRVAEAKHPAYHMEPSGSRIKDYIETENHYNLTPIQFQENVTENKRHFETTPGQNGFKRLMENNDVVIVAVHEEASYAFAMAEGIPTGLLSKLNEKLVKSDLTIILDSQPVFKKTGNRDKDSKNERKAKTIQMNQKILAPTFGWEVVDANQSPDEVHNDVFKIVSQRLEDILVPLG